MRQVEPKRTTNQRLYDLTVAMETALIECDEMGIEAERVEFDGRFPPRIFVMNNGITRQLLREGKAHYFGTEVYGGVRCYLIQMMVNNCKIIWKTDSLTH